MNVYYFFLQAFGTHGMALSENIRETSTIIDSVGGGKSKRLFNSFPQRFEAAFESELEHFADCLDGKTFSSRLVYTYYRAECH